MIIEHQKIEIKKVWIPMGKSIANLYRYVEISKSITKRYIEALPEINVEDVSLKELENLYMKIMIKKNINKTTRLLSKLKAHGPIKKVVKKNKYYLTTRGRELINHLLLYTGRTILN